MRSRKRFSCMGALRRCGIKPLLFFFVLFTFVIVLLHTKLADNSIGDPLELPVMNDRRVYPITYSKDLKNGQDIQQDMQQDFNQERDADEEASLHSQYILPVLLGNNGPNNQIQSLKLVSIIAQRRNLTLVLAPFFDHGATLETQRPHTFEETLDPDMLAQFVSVVTMEEFKRQCKGTVDAVFLGTNMVINQTLSKTKKQNIGVGHSVKAYYTWTGVTIPSTFLYMNRSDDVIQIHADLPYDIPVEDFLDKYPDSLTTSHRCNAFLYPYGYLGRLVYWEHINRYTKYFVRGKAVRETAQTFIKTAMRNLTYVCIHWRYNREWKKYWCSKHRADNDLDLCNSLDTLAPYQLATKMSHFMAESDIKAAYFASELDNQNDLVKGLRQGVPNIHTTSDLIDESPKLSRDNNYLTSLVEQEICKESTFYLSSKLSSWSDMVIEDRYNQRWQDVDELFR